MLIYYVVFLILFSIFDAKENFLFSLNYSWTIYKIKLLFGGLVMAGWPIKTLL